MDCPPGQNKVTVVGSWPLVKSVLYPTARQRYFKMSPKEDAK